MSTKDLNKDRLVEVFMQAVEANEHNADHYVYRNRHYRTRQVTVTVSEIDTSGGGWTFLPLDLTDQLAAKISSGEAVRT